MAIKVPKALVFRGKKWNGRSNGGGRVRISAELQYEKPLINVNFVKDPLSYVQHSAN